MTLYGSGFKRSPDAKVRFASELEFTEVDLVYVSDSEARCVTPARIAPSVTHVTASNDGRQYSGWPLVYAKGSGTFLKSRADSDADASTRRDANGINPSLRSSSGGTSTTPPARTSAAPSRDPRGRPGLGARAGEERRTRGERV